MRLKTFVTATVLLLGLSPGTIALASEAQSDGTSPVYVEEGSRRHGDMVLIGREIEIRGTVNGTVVSMFGRVRISGLVTGDLIVFGRDVDIVAPGRVAGDVLVVGGNLHAPADPALDPKAASPIGGRRLSIEALEAAFLAELQTSPVAGRAVSPLLLALRLLVLSMWLVFGLALLWWRPRRVATAAAFTPRSFPLLLSIGASAVMSGVMLASLLLALIPAGAAMGLVVLIVAALALTKLFGLVALCVFFGRRLTQAAPRGNLLFGDPAALAIGLSVLGVVSLVPAAGPVIWLVVSLIAIGLALLTWFGRSSPLPSLSSGEAAAG